MRATGLARCASTPATGSRTSSTINHQHARMGLTILTDIVVAMHGPGQRASIASCGVRGAIDTPRSALSGYELNAANSSLSTANPAIRGACARICDTDPRRMSGD